MVNIPPGRKSTRIKQPLDPTCNHPWPPPKLPPAPWRSVRHAESSFGAPLVHQRPYTTAHYRCPLVVPSTLYPFHQHLWYIPASPRRTPNTRVQVSTLTWSGSLSLLSLPPLYTGNCHLHIYIAVFHGSYRSRDVIYIHNPTFNICARYREKKN